ncbi:MAG: HEAT repeat domain-containing protein [Deltaproteobacteria bacterium]
MIVEHSSGRQLKREVLGLLKSENFSRALSELRLLPARRVINPLLSLFCHDDEEVRWRAITAAGEVVEHLAATDRESARVIMRRLIWSLNDESGGIGWGAPEAMGEIMARDEAFAQEYSSIFISYMAEEGNFLEYEILQRGLLWGLVRLAQARPHLLEGAVPHLSSYLESRDAGVRGLAALAAGLLDAEELRPKLEALMGDQDEFFFYNRNELDRYRVAQMAQEALARLDR